MDTPEEDDEDENSQKSEKKFEYISSNRLYFRSENNGKIKCGNCNKEFQRITSHLKNGCKGVIPEAELEELKTQLDKFRHNKWKETEKFKDPLKFKLDKKKCQDKWEAKILSEDPYKFKERKKERQVKWKDKAETKNVKKYKKELQARNSEYHKKKKRKIGSWERFKRFRTATRYGPIFICSSCHQKLFEHQVISLDESFEKEINEKYNEAFTKNVDEKVKVSILVQVRNEVRDKGLNYICKTCKRFLIKGKMPKLNKNNGLNVDIIPEGIPNLTELESNLIAKNLIFQKYHKMPKSRWSGTHDRLVNVPIHDRDILNTIEKLPRTPAEAGIIPLPVTANLKRKMEYKNNHIQQIINPTNVYKFLNFLRDSGHPSYQFFNSRDSFEARCEEEDPSGYCLLYPEYENLQTPQDQGTENVEDEFEN